MEEQTTEVVLSQPTLKVRQIVSGQNYRENYDAAAMAAAVDRPMPGSVALGVARSVRIAAARPAA